MSRKKYLAMVVAAVCLAMPLLGNSAANAAPVASTAVQQRGLMPFRAARIDRNITRIKDMTGDMMYLVEGRDRAALIDTGVGVGSLKAYVEKLTDKPLVVIITHGHVDHASGTAEFADVYMSREDGELFKEHTSFANRTGYIGAGNPAFARSISEVDYQPQDNPERFKDLRAGDTIDLGGVHLDIYAIEGHTHGMKAVLLRENRALLTGDGANMFTFLFAKETLGLKSYKASLQKLQKATAGKYDKVYCSHGGGDLTVDYLERLIEDCDHIMAGKDDKVPFEFMGQKANIAYEIGPDRNRLDGGIGNIVYDPQRIEE